MIFSMNTSKLIIIYTAATSTTRLQMKTEAIILITVAAVSSSTWGSGLKKIDMKKREMKTDGMVV